MGGFGSVIPTHVSVSDLNVGDVVRVYDGDDILRGSATVSLGTSVSFDLDIYAPYGILYVTVQSIGETESEPTTKHF